MAEPVEIAPRAVAEALLDEERSNAADLVFEQHDREPRQIRSNHPNSDDP
jgi:hypothetical protein